MFRSTLIALLSIPCALIAQTNGQTSTAYFQQEMNYKIDVSLNDQSHTLTGNLDLKYKNNSPNELTFIYFHIWANAYKDNSSAFAKQKANNSTDLSFQFAKEDDRGYLDNLQFKVDGVPTKITPDPKNIDIIRIDLPKPLKSGAQVTITTPFNVKLPYTFSRGGHVEQAYQITQWYPKPAVYDREGWHPMPYLDQGEFYSEYGNFDVTISLPQNYIVAATGELDNAAERTFLDGLAAAKNPPLDSFPESSKTIKTIRYTASKVHDFAWFADKRFAVRKAQANLLSGKSVDTWAYFPAGKDARNWEKAAENVARAVSFYSEKVGDYPYMHASAVRGPLKAGGGMEYPMVTVIAGTNDAETLDNVLAHEVGHNWFYGILGSNERDHPWMDEGMNSYIESRYMDTYYPNNAGSIGLPKGLTGGEILRQDVAVHYIQGRHHLDQACDTPSGDFQPINYFLGAYGKPTLIFRYLQAYLGTAAADKAMHDYYTAWQFKHPQPADVQASYEKSTGKKLDWLFADLIKTTRQLDYAITKINVDGIFTVVNKGEIAGPFCVSAIKDDKVVGTEWYDGFSGKQEFAPKGSISRPADRFVINADNSMPELNRHNNTLRTSGIFPAIPHFKIKPLLAWDDPKKTSIFVSPIIGFNNYDKLMIGTAIYSNLIPSKMDFTLMPMYGLGSKNLTGLADINYRIFPKTGGIRSITLGANAKTFNASYNPLFDYHLKYTKVAPRLEIELRNKPTGATHIITARSMWINEESQTFALSDTSINARFAPAGKTTESRIVNDVQYELKNSRKFCPYSVKVQLTHSPDNGAHAFARASVEGNYRLTYKKDGGGLDIRAFVGKMLYNASGAYPQYGGFSPYGFSLASHGENDFAYDQNLMGRSDNVGIWSQQIGLGAGGFKTPTFTTSNFATSTDLVASLNLRAALPFKIPIKPYLDLGYHKITQPSLVFAGVKPADEILWAGGAQLSIADVLNINFPLVQSDNLEREMAQRGSYLNRITFSLDLLKLNPRKVLRTLKF